MYCPKCGASHNGQNFCPSCGYSFLNNQNSMSDSQNYYQLPRRDRPEPQGSPGVVLTFGIIGIALMSTGILGLIFSIIGLVKASGYQNKYGNISGQVRTGRILSIVGIILSILMIILWVFIIVMIVKSYDHIHTYGSYHSSYGSYRF